MSNNGEPGSIVNSAPQNKELDSAKLAAFAAKLEDQQNLVLGVIGGTIAAVIGAAIWAAITVATKFQIGWMAIGVGFLVGIAVRTFGKGITRTFGIVGAVLSLLGCMLGNVLSSCGFLSMQESIPYFQLVVSVISKPDVILELLKITFTPMDVVFYGIAVSEGYKIAIRRISEAEIKSLTSTR
jgi:hypothetical protein